MKPLLLYISLLHLITTCTGTVINVSLETRTYSDPGCIGGNVGLANTSILLQYRLLMPPTSWEWTFLSEITIEGSTSLSVSIVPISDSSQAQGLQFRLLQLEHGGEACNCWTVERLTVTLPPSSLIEVTNINRIECYSQGQKNAGQRNFCYGTANKARGIITKAHYFDTNGVECPGNSGISLFHSERAAVVENCNTVTPRM